MGSGPGFELECLFLSCVEDQTVMQRKSGMYQSCKLSNKLSKLMNRCKFLTNNLGPLVRVTVVFQVAMLLGIGTGLCETALQVIPKPLEVKESKGSFNLSSNTVILADKNSINLASYTQDFLRMSTGYAFPVKSYADKSRAKPDAIILQQAKLSEDLGVEGYKLSVTQNGVVIRAESQAGLFYGVQTLKQLLPLRIKRREVVKDVGVWTIPCVEITDKPRFEWRGLMIDSSRTFQSVEYLKKTIELMAMYKMNVFHWHLTDDQGWRLEIKKYPKLTRKGARFPTKWNQPESYQGYYTQDEVRDLVAYAQARNITIVPEIEMPGHTLGVLTCYPELSCTGGPFEIHPFTKGPGIHKDIFCAGNEKSFEFLENVLKEVIELFPSEYVHVGGDEAPKHRWRQCAKCQQRIKDENLRNEHALQSYFINRMGKFLEKHNKKFMGWNEILGAGLSEKAAIMSWQGMRGGYSAAKSGRKAVMSPTTYCYFDYSYRSISTQKAYQFEPIPEDFNPKYAKNILGIQANFWSHLDREPHLVDKQLWPRLISIAERGWVERSVRDWDDFSRRLGTQLDRLHMMDVKFYPPNLVGLKLDRAFVDQTTAGVINTSKVMDIHYTLDGSEPTISSPLYTKPIVLKKSTTVKAKGFLPDGRTTQLLTGSYKKQSYRKSAAVAPSKAGLRCEYRLGAFKSFDDISKGEIKQISIQPQIDIPDYAVKSNEKDGSFTLSFTGYVEVPRTAIYTFYIQSDDGGQLFIGDELVVDNARGRSKERSGQIALEAGHHPIKVLYYEGMGGESLKVSYSNSKIPQQQIPEEQLSH